MVALQMTDEDIVTRVAAMFARKPGKWQPREAHWQPIYLVRITGAKAVAWMNALRPLMGLRRIYDLRGGRTHKQLKGQ